MASAIASNIRALRRPATIGGQERLRTRMPARIKVGTERASCTLLDISLEGACLSVEGSLNQDAKIWLIVDNLPPIAAAPAWRHKGRIGVKFEAGQEYLMLKGAERPASVAAASGGSNPSQNDWIDF
jgi:hypothetical protein